MFEPVLTKYVLDKDSRKIDFYLSCGGYSAARKALLMGSSELTALVKDSGLRGRGGAGFPTGLKWTFVPKDNEGPVYLSCNADESEPGTFKDRLLIEEDPHQVLEGIIICCWAISSNQAYIYIRGEFTLGAKVLNAAIEEARARGYIGKDIFGSGFDLDVFVVRGAGAYICGEETSQLSSIEGGRGYPRLKPPFPAVVGLFSCPTIINNVETLCNLPHIVNRGVSWYRSFGTERSPGIKIFSVSGHVNRPGNYELPLGISLREIIYDYAGGVRGGKGIKGIIPGGSSTPVLGLGSLDVSMDYESLSDAGSMLGSGAITVMDEDTCMVGVAHNLMRFYHHESCGQCTPCREGTGWLCRVVGRIEAGEGRRGDIELLFEICDNMQGNTICVLADAAVMPLRSYLDLYRGEFEAKIRF